MARSYYKRKRTAKRFIPRKRVKRARRRKTGYRSAYRIPRFKAPLGNFPNRKTVALRYVESVAFDASSTAAAVNVFAVNNIYDPNTSGTGHQPMFRDNYAAIYERYKVNYATITMVAMTTHKVNVISGADEFYANNQKACRMWILRDKSTNDYPNSLDTLVEQGSTNLVWKYCPQQTSGYMPTLKYRCWPHKICNVNFTDDTLTAPMASPGAPGNPAYFVCGVSDLGDATNPGSIVCQFIITYNVTFYDLIKNQTPS